jgi:outer membrane protein TolC
MPAMKSVSPDKALVNSPNIRAVLGRMATAPLTITDAVALALYTSRTIATAEEALRLAQGKTSEARAAFNPNLSSLFTFTQLNQNATANIAGESFTLTNASQRQIGMQATLPIDISGMLRAATDQARLQEIVARLDVNRARNQLVLDVKSAFYSVLRAQALLNVADEGLRNSVARQTDAQIRLDAGVAAPYDLQKAATDVANAQLQVLSARNQVSQSLYTLKNTIGIDSNSTMTISDAGAVETPPGVIDPANGPVIPPRPAEQAPPKVELNPITNKGPVTVADPMPALPDFAALLADALRTRPEIMEADASIAAAKKGITLAYRSQLPTLGLVVNGAYAPDTVGFGAQTTSASAVVSLNAPIYDGGVAHARKREAQAEVAQAVTSRRTTIDSVTYELQSVYQNLRIARDSLAVANQSLALTREAYRLAGIRYTAGVTAQAGVSPLIELTDAQTALTQAESNQVNALYNYNNSRSMLDKAVGRYAFVFNGGKEPAYLGFSAPPSAKMLGNVNMGAAR